MFVNVCHVGLIAITMFILHNQTQKLYLIAMFHSPMANFVCLDVNRGGTNCSRCTQTLVILHASILNKFANNNSRLAVVNVISFVAVNGIVFCNNWIYWFILRYSALFIALQIIQRLHLLHNRGLVRDRTTVFRLRKYGKFNTAQITCKTHLLCVTDDAALAVEALCLVDWFVRVFPRNRLWLYIDIS